MGNVLQNTGGNTLKVHGGGVFGSAVSAITVVQALSISLTTAGRIGFYVDYSELTTNGTHTFYFCRTHGTTGAVSATYTSSGDAHTIVTGAVTWADGDAGIKSITVPVSAGNLTTHDGLGLGEHRIAMTLSSPTGGAVLHHGAYTKAYGVIDNATMIASNTNAVFYDSAATGGTGTQADPYDSYYTARDNIGSKRYLYGKGTTTPDGTDTADVGGSVENCLLPPPTRTSEATRVIIRSWPSFTWTVDGGVSTRTCGFADIAGRKYQTYRKIDFNSLDTSGGTFSEAGAIFLENNGTTTPTAINVERCTADDINGGSNVGAYSFQNTTGCKIWRSTANNVQIAGLNTDHNAAGIFSWYDAISLTNMFDVSVQRCEVTNTFNAAYHKKAGNGTSTNTTASHRFNIYSSVGRGVHFGGTSGYAHARSIVQCNLFKTINTSSLGSGVYHGGGYTSGVGDGIYHWWCNNVFDSVGNNGNAPFYFKQTFETAIFNNIFYNSEAAWHQRNDDSLSGTEVSIGDYNHAYNYQHSNIYKYHNVAYTTASALTAAFSQYAVNDDVSDPLFVSATDYNLGASSPCLANGIGSVDQGIYWTGLEVIGA